MLRSPLVIGLVTIDRIAVAMCRNDTSMSSTFGREARERASASLHGHSARANAFSSPGRCRCGAPRTDHVSVKSSTAGAVIRAARLSRAEPEVLSWMPSANTASSAASEIRRSSSC